MPPLLPSPHKGVMCMQVSPSRSPEFSCYEWLQCSSSTSMILTCSTMPMFVDRPAAGAALWLINAALSKHVQDVLSQSSNSLDAQGKDSAWPLKMVWCWPGTCKGRAFPNKPCASASFFSTNASRSSYGACIHQLLKQAESCLDRLQAQRSTVQG